MPVAEACRGSSTYSRLHPAGTLHICETLRGKIQTYSMRFQLRPWRIGLGMQFTGQEGAGMKDEAKVLRPHGRREVHLWRILHTG